MIFLILTLASIFHHVDTLNQSHAAELTAGILSLRKFITDLTNRDLQTGTHSISHKSQSKSCDYSLQAQSNRLSLILYYPYRSSDSLLDLHPTTSNFLANCAWDMNVTSYVYDSHGNVTETVEGVHFGGHSDAVAFARNVAGNLHILPGTCASIWQGSNDKGDGKFFRKIMPLELKPEEAPDTIMARVSTQISKQTHDVFKPLYTQYSERFSKPAARFGHSLLNSDQCKNILITGHSLGAALASIYRIDFGEVYEGMYTHTCFGAKPCYFFSILGLQGIWFRNVPEFATYSNSTVCVWYETDPTATTLPTWLASLPLKTQKVLHLHGLSQFSDPYRILLRWRIRDSVIHQTHAGIAFRRVVVDTDVVNMTAWEFRSSPAYIARLHDISSIGPLVSLRVCGVAQTQDICNHNAAAIGMEDFLKMDDEMEKGDAMARFSGTVIPDLPGSLWNRFTSLLAGLSLI
jgi:hypothetical protein